MAHLSFSNLNATKVFKTLTPIVYHTVHLSASLIKKPCLVWWWWWPYFRKLINLINTIHSRKSIICALCYQVRHVAVVGPYRVISILTLIGDVCINLLPCLINLAHFCNFWLHFLFLSVNVLHLYFVLECQSGTTLHFLIMLGYQYLQFTSLSPNSNLYCILCPLEGIHEIYCSTICFPPQFTLPTKISCSHRVWSTFSG